MTPARRSAPVARPDVPADVLDRLRAVCLPLPGVREEQAWVGTRWSVGRHTFAHVLVIDQGWPPAYARAAATDGPCCVLTFRSSGSELAALHASGPPVFVPRWFPDIVGVALDDRTDWAEVEELVVESHRLLAQRAGSR